MFNNYFILLFNRFVNTIRPDVKNEFDKDDTTANPSCQQSGKSVQMGRRNMQR